MFGGAGKNRHWPTTWLRGISTLIGRASFRPPTMYTTRCGRIRATDPRRVGLFRRTVRETPKIPHAYQFEGAKLCVSKTTRGKIHETAILSALWKREILISIRPWRRSNGRKRNGCTRRGPWPTDLAYIS